MSSFQYVTLVAFGGTPIRIADQTGAPLPTTGTGALVFANGPTLTNAVLNGYVVTTPIGLPSGGSIGSPPLYFGSISAGLGLRSSGVGNISLVFDGAAMFSVTDGNVTMDGAIVGASMDGLDNTFTNLPGSAIVGTVAVANGGTGATTAINAAVNLSGAYSVTNLAALKAMTARPPLVNMLGYSTAGDGGGGVFLWAAGSVVTADNGTVVQPTVNDGRYFRIYSGAKDVRWYGVIDGVQDRTVINLALAQGGHVLLGGGLTYVIINPLTMSVAGTILDGGGTATINDGPNQTSTLCQVFGDGCVIKDLTMQVTQSTVVASFLRLRANSCRVENVTMNGTNWSIMDYSTIPTPTYHIEQSGATGTIYYDTVIRNVKISGGYHGINFSGADRVIVEGVKFFNNAGHALGGSNPVPWSRATITDIQCIGTGLYGLTFGNLTTTGLNQANAQYPTNGILVENFYATGTGWGTYFTGADGALGGGKYGADFTGNAIRRITTRNFVAYNCALGAAEIKRTNAPPAPVVTPTGYHDCDYDIQDYSNLPFGEGVFLGQGNNTLVASTFQTNFRMNVRSRYEDAPAWVTSQYYDPRASVTLSNGSTWLCFGALADGTRGISGATAPTGGQDPVLVSTNASTAQGGSQLHFASAAGIVAGMTLFITGGDSLLPDRTTVTSVVGNDVNLSSTVTAVGGVPSSTLCLFVMVVSDDVLNWACVKQTAPGAVATSRSAVRMDSVSNVTGYIESYGNGVGLLMRTATSSDHAVDTVDMRVFARDCTNGVLADSTAGGYTNIKLRDCDINATAEAIHFGFTGTTNSLYILGGHIRGTNSVRIREGTTQLFLHGDARISGTAAAFLSAATTVLTATVGACYFRNGTDAVCQINGTGASTWYWGAGATIYNANRASVAGWTSTGGAVVYGKVLAQDIIAPPTSGTTIGAVGEYTDYTPTTAAHGSVCLGSNVWRPVGYAVPFFSVSLTAVNFNSANSDNAVTIALPAGYTRYVIREVWISHASHDITTATCGLFTAPAGGGTAIVTGGSAITVSATTENAANNAMVLAIATGATQSFDDTSLFFYIGTAEGAAATADVLIVYEPLS